jgi:translocation and assembly module TamA
MQMGRSGARPGEGKPRGHPQLAAALLLLIVLGCASQDAASKAKGQLVVRDLELAGARRVAPRQIKKKILTSETGWWWPFARKQIYDPVAWQGDLARIERLYEARGYYQAEVIKDEVRPDGKGGVALRAEISEGEPTRIGSLDVRGLDQLAANEREEVLDELPLEKGDVFVEARWDAAKRQIQERLRDLGHAQADVDAQALVDVKTHAASLTIVARPGIRYRFGDIQVDVPPGGQVSPVWIWEQARLAIPEGETFSDRALAEAQRRVFSMGVFAMARVTLGTPDPAAGRVPVVVSVREAPFHTLRTGGGLRFDQIRNEARLLLEWTDRNFKGGMRKLTARAQAGWAFIPNTYAVLRDRADAGARNGPIARTGLELEQPRFVGRPSLRARIKVELEKTLEQAYDAVGGRFVTGVVWQPRAALSVYPTYNVELFWMQGPPLAGVATAPLAIGCPSQSDDCFVRLSYLEQLLVWDKRDDILEPRRGFYASLSLQEGAGVIGTFTYLRVMPELRGYVSLGDDDLVTLAGRVAVGQLLPSAGQESAVITRFFAGGGVSMRGFSNRRLSPLLLAPAPAPSDVLLTLPIGGNGIIDGNFEARLRLGENLMLAAFVDFGQVTRDRLGLGGVPRLLWAVGVGLRYRTPIGPIRVDFARRLQVGRPPPLLTINETTGAVSEVPYLVDDSCFGLGGSGRETPVPDNLCVLHLSIGEAF